MRVQESPFRRHDKWASFVADATARGRVVRGLHEEQNPRHRLRVEHDARTLLIHLSDEDGDGWTTVAVDRATRRWAVAQRPRQVDAAREAFEALYGRDRGPLRTPGQPALANGSDELIPGVPG